jgi:hypothetical protein
MKAAMRRASDNEGFFLGFFRLNKILSEQRRYLTKIFCLKVNTVN